MRTVSMVVHRTAPRRDVTGTRRLQICLVRIAGDNRACRRIYGFGTGPDRLDRTVLLELVLEWQLERRFSRQTTDANIDTVMPNSTEVTSPGALARIWRSVQTGQG